MTDAERERAAVVAWLRQEASEIFEEAGDDLPLRTASAFLHGAANDIAQGAHPKDPHS